MGSSIFISTPWALLALFCAILCLAFDGARYFVQRLGAVKLRRWAAEPTMRGGDWFEYDPDKFALVSGALLQTAMMTGLGATIAAIEGPTTPVAALLAVVVWIALFTGWKFVLALLPEEIAEHSLRSLIAISHVFYYLFWPILFPLRWTINRVETRRDEITADDEVSDDEVRAYIDVGEEEGILEEGEGKLVQSIVDFGDRIAREAMTPRVELQAFDVNGSFDALARLFGETKYSRIPVYERDVDHVVGIVHVKDLFDIVLKGETRSVRELMRQAYFVSETKLLFELLREFQTEHIQVAIVVDEFGGTAGLVSIEDVVEEIVGDISDEHEDEEATVVEIEPGVYLVNGMTRTENIRDVFGVDIDDEGYETVAGLIFTATGRVPKVSEVVRKNGLVFEVERADRKRIYRVRVTRDVAVPAVSVAERA
ncbi:MAG: hemolysin family protein [Thermoanaerobaculia bacterium]|jgi:CBS domain containing-hemolysin-like protein